MDADSKNKERQVMRYAPASFISVAVGAALGIAGPCFMPHPERPEIDKKNFSAHEEVSQLKRTKQGLVGILNDEENAILSQLEGAIDTRQKRIAEIEKNPEFQEYQEAYREHNNKWGYVAYTGLGIFAVGGIGFFMTALKAIGMLREPEQTKKVGSE
jgi:hypothetical protein